MIPFNPLDTKIIGASVADALLVRDATPLAKLTSFRGAGIYAIYYSGPFLGYAALAALNREVPERPRAPIYVGKAVPAGARKGTFNDDAAHTKVLYSRLTEHAESIKATQLDIGDFRCRYLVVEDIWIPLAESLLIAKFSPLWNSLIDGFGNHDPGKGRYGGMMPRWDVLHPGRSWAAKCQLRPETQIAIERDVKTFLRNYLPPLST